jgi:hypothetical protein
MVGPPRHYVNLAATAAIITAVLWLPRPTRSAGEPTEHRGNHSSSPPTAPALHTRAHALLERNPHAPFSAPPTSPLTDPISLRTRPDPTRFNHNTQSSIHPTPHSVNECERSGIPSCAHTLALNSHEGGSRVKPEESQLSINAAQTVLQQASIIAQQTRPPLRPPHMCMRPAHARAHPQPTAHNMRAPAGSRCTARRGAAAGPRGLLRDGRGRGGGGPVAPISVCEQGQARGEYVHT